MGTVAATGREKEKDVVVVAAKLAANATFAATQRS
jgi:hypothetical protein